MIDLKPHGDVHNGNDYDKIIIIIVFIMMMMMKRGEDVALQFVGGGGAEANEEGRQQLT